MAMVPNKLSAKNLVTWLSGWTSESIATSYLVMMLLTGVTIGAISGLSNTSVSNTLVELILVFISGSAGIYFLNRETLTKEANALDIIGKVGIVFLLSFWAGYLLTTFYRYSGEDYYSWQNSLGFDDNLALAELHGHGQKLGISTDDLSKAYEAVLDDSGSGLNCALLSDDPRQVSSLIAMVYDGLSSSNIFDPLAKSSANFLSQRFRGLDQDLKSPDPETRTAAAVSLESAVATLLALSRDQPDIASPSRYLCASATRDANATCVLAIDLEKRLGVCSGSAIVDLLLVSRSHARAFNAIWKQPVSTGPAKARGTFERRDEPK